MKSHEISGFLQSRIDAGDFPSAVYLVAEKGEIVFQDALGYAVVEPEKIEAGIDTIYDVASLTKPLVTGLLTARQINDGETELDSPIGSSLYPELRGSSVSTLTYRELLIHTSGLPAWLPLYLFAESRVSVGKTIADRALLTQRKMRVEYSDLNFILLGYAIEGAPIDGEFGYEVIDTLGLRKTSFNPLTSPWKTKFERKEIAASENGNEYERQTCAERYPEIRIPQSAFRNHILWGEVHDGNAYFMGGVAGHAGLFSTAEEVFRIALQFLPNYTTLLKPETCEMFRTNFTKGMNEARSVAFQLAETPVSTAGSLMSPQSFGHTGFTGTSLWVDPVTERIFILLTNRTHAHPLPFVNINSVRRRFHDMAIELLEKNL